jgi:hypothetical protein
VVSDARRHCGRPITPAAAILIDLKAKCFDMTSKVVHDIFPDTGGFKHITLLGEAQRFTNQTPVHVTGGQVGAFHVSRVLAQQSGCEQLVAVDNTRLGTDDPSILALLDHLHILPTRLWSFLCGWASTSLVGGHFAVDFNQCLAMSAPAIGGQVRRLVGLAALFELGKGLD